MPVRPRRVAWRGALLGLTVLHALSGTDATCEQYQQWRRENSEADAKCVLPRPWSHDRLIHTTNAFTRVWSRSPHKGTMSGSRPTPRCVPTARRQSRRTVTTHTKPPPRSCNLDSC